MFCCALVVGVEWLTSGGCSWSHLVSGEVAMFEDSRRIVLVLFEVFL